MGVHTAKFAATVMFYRDVSVMPVRRQTDKAVWFGLDNGTGLRD
jgi:hypothetical protein